MCCYHSNLSEQKKWNDNFWPANTALGGENFTRKPKEREKKVCTNISRIEEGLIFFFTCKDILFYLGAIQIRRVGIGQKHSTNNHKAGT